MKSLMEALAEEIEEERRIRRNRRIWTTTVLVFIFCVSMVWCWAHRQDEIRTIRGTVYTQQPLEGK